METVTLRKPITIDNKEVKEINLDFTKLNGYALVEAENKSRMMGDATPDLSFSMKYQALLASKASGIKYDDILSLPAPDMIAVITTVKNFLFG